MNGRAVLHDVAPRSTIRGWRGSWTFARVSADSSWAAFFVLLGITASHLLLETARDALFLAKLPASRLPLVYIALAGLGLLIAQIQSRIARPPSPRRLSLTVLFAAAATVGFWLMSGWKGTWFLYALYVYAGVAVGWITVEFWLLLSNAVTMQQAQTAAGLHRHRRSSRRRGRGDLRPGPGRFLAHPAPSPGRGSGAGRCRIGVRYCFSMPAAGGGATVAQGDPAQAGRQSQARGEDGGELRPGPYPPLFQAHPRPGTPHHPDGHRGGLHVQGSGEELGRSRRTGASTSPPGTWSSTSLHSSPQTLGVRWLIRQFKVQGVLWIMPVCVVLGAAGALIGGGLVAAIGLKWIDGGLRHSVHQTSLELLYIPTPDSQRARGQAAHRTWSASGVDRPWPRSASWRWQRSVSNKPGSPWPSQHSRWAGSSSPRLSSATTSSCFATPCARVASTTTAPCPSSTWRHSSLFSAPSTAARTPRSSARWKSWPCKNGAT